MFMFLLALTLMMMYLPCCKRRQHVATIEQLRDFVQRVPTSRCHVSLTLAPELLDQLVGPRLDIEDIPTPSCSTSNASGSDDRDLCSICLDELGVKRDGGLRRITRCNHLFHAVCIDRWLVEHSAYCPVCKQLCIVSPPDTILHYWPSTGIQIGQQSSNMDPDDLELEMVPRWDR